MIEEFRNYLEIDKNSLDDEVVQHPSLFFRVSEAYVEAAAVRDIAKEELATVDAELDRQIRENFEGEKITEATIKNQIQTHKAHKAAMDAYLTAKHNADLLGVLKEAFSVKGYMVRDLCSLAVANYFESTSIRSEQTDQTVYKANRARLAEARERR